MTVAPDEGMAELQRRMTAAQPGAGAAAGAGAGVDVFVRLAAALESNTDALTRRTAAGQWAWEHVHPAEAPGSQVNTAGANAAGTYAAPDLWGPRQGWAWRVGGVSVILGTGTTSFAIWQDSPGDPTNELFSSTVSGRWEPQRFIMLPGSFLVYTAVGGGITVGKMKVEEIAIAHLPRYLGFRG